MAAFKRKDRPTEGYRIRPSLPAPWGRVGPWQTGFKSKRDAEKVEAWLQEMALVMPALIDALVAGTFTVREAWIAKQRGALDDLVRGVTDPFVHDVVEQLKTAISDDRVLRGLDVVDERSQGQRMSWLADPANVNRLYENAKTAMSDGSVRRSVHRAVAELLARHFGKSRRDQVFVDVDVPQQDDEREVRVTGSELRSVLSECAPEFRDMPVLAILLGIDREPLLRITPRFFNEQLGTLEVLDHKTSARPRVIELSTPAMAILRARCASRAIDEQIFNYTPGQVRHHWEAARDRAAGRPTRATRRYRGRAKNLEAIADPRGERALQLLTEQRVVTLPILRFKDLRHLLPTAWNALGLPPEDIRGIMGWAKHSNMGERYTTARIQGDRENLDRVAEFLGLDKYPLRAEKTA